MLKLENCRERQTRLLKLMESRQFDLAILSNPKTIYYFSGALIPPQAPHAFLLTSSGKSVLITHAPIGESPVPPVSAANETELYNWHSIENNSTPTTWDQDVAARVRDAAQKLRPAQLQQDTWGHVMEAHDIARKAIRPGVPAKEIYRKMKDHLDKFERTQGSFRRHAGHGLGMSGWELPWLTPGSDDVIQDREVLACEPALYASELQGGIRLEHDYLVTPEGAIALDHFPMELT